MLGEISLDRLGEGLLMLWLANVIPEALELGGDVMGGVRNYRMASLNETRLSLRSRILSGWPSVSVASNSQANLVSSLAAKIGR